MPTANEIILRGLRRIGVVAEDAAATAVQANNGLTTLNSMMHEWKARGADVEHTDYILTSEFALGAEYVKATVDLLAVQLADDYSLDITPVLARNARAGWNAIYAAFGASTRQTVPISLRSLGGARVSAAQEQND